MSDYVATTEGPDADPITGPTQLVEHILRGAKPREDWRLGTELEFIAVRRDDARAIPWSGPDGVEVLLREIGERFGWEQVREGAHTIGLSRGETSITLEPGGQIELSGRPVQTLTETREEIEGFARELVTVADGHGVAVLGLGAQPVSRLDEIEWVPKKRYGIMAAYMTRVGRHGQRMMKQTGTVQVNVDFQSATDAIDKMRIATGIGPILNAIFANSPLIDGEDSGYLSFRGQVWTDVDAARCGMLPFLFHERAGVEQYVEWALDAPMYFVRRNGVYIDLSGVPFRDFMRRGAAGHEATVGDFALHLSTLFPEVRLKTYIELRMIDAQPRETILALPAIAKSLLYEDDCRAGVWDLVKRWTLDERREILRDGCRYGLATRAGRFRLQDLARELLAIAATGLRRLGDSGEPGDGAAALDTVAALVEEGRCPATASLEAWRDGPPAGQTRRLIDRTQWAF